MRQIKKPHCIETLLTNFSVMQRPLRGKGNKKIGAYISTVNSEITDEAYQEIRAADEDKVILHALLVDASIVEQMGETWTRLVEAVQAFAAQPVAHVTEPAQPVPVVVPKARKYDLTKGQWGAFWDRMCHRGFFNGEIFAIGRDQKLREEFAAESLSEISPNELKTWLEDLHAEGMITDDKYKFAYGFIERCEKGESR